MCMCVSGCVMFGSNTNSPLVASISSYGHREESAEEMGHRQKQVVDGRITKEPSLVDKETDANGCPGKSE